MDVGVIGVGTMGKNHARVYSELRLVEDLYLYDTNRPVVENLARQYGAIACGSQEELLSRVEAVDICVPTPYHFKVARESLGRGLATLIEKPVCATVAEGEELLLYAVAVPTVGVGHIERFNPIVEEIRRIVRKPLYIEMKRHNPASARVTGTSVVEDLMIHDIDIAFQLFFNTTYTLQSAGTEDVCTALIQMGSPPLYSIPVYLSASRRAAKKIRSIYVETEDSTIEGNFMSQEITVYRRPDQYSIDSQRYVQESRIETVLVNKVEPLKIELSTFLTCARAGKPFPVTPQQAVQNLRICDEIRRGCACAPRP